ncbi:MAG: hypothetical protein IPP86_04270 [Bacteroidetes bacterium]|nr:hypothetical protein [Bacteroidota bacterium]
MRENLILIFQEKKQKIAWEVPITGSSRQIPCSTFSGKLLGGAGLDYMQNIEQTADGIISFQEHQTLLSQQIKVRIAWVD